MTSNMGAACAARPSEVRRMHESAGMVDHFTALMHSFRPASPKVGDAVAPPAALEAAGNHIT